MIPASLPLFFSAIAVVLISSPELIPTHEGMTWHYFMHEEAGPGVRLAEAGEREAGTLRAEVVYRVEGTKELDGKKLIQFEMHRGGQITNTDLLTVNEDGVRCWARIDDEGQVTKLDPPQLMVSAPLEVGHTWDFDNDSNGTKVHQHYEIVGRGQIDTAAGEFRAFHIHCEQDSPMKMTIDRWFAPGIGIVKDVTETHSDTGELLRRITLELSREPKVDERPQVTVRPGENKLKVTLSQEAVGESQSIFLSVAPKICARWQGRSLQPGSKVRALWIAESVAGVAPPDYTIDEATATATAANSHGIFTLGRPEGGWTPGVYRVEFYIDGTFADAAKLKIMKPAAAAFGE